MRSAEGWDERALSGMMEQIRFRPRRPSTSFSRTPRLQICHSVYLRNLFRVGCFKLKFYRKFKECMIYRQSIYYYYYYLLIFFFY